ncbi:hypothetical protein [Salinivibrio socompensis]|uniref:hypothetical protein n=1 Tax=Salinivibrio socompensis TaxID=1510206 RepID=UPI000FE14430|nr:hypothetical protein [Salinivibrio socompensis]
MAIGATNPVINTLWAEMYGVSHIGAIRSLVTGMMILSTALSPWIFGIVIDIGWTLMRLLTHLSGLFFRFRYCFCPCIHVSELPVTSSMGKVMIR